MSRTSAGEPYVIAEIGVNHANSIERAFKMIEEAHEGGAHAAKFQTYKADRLAIKDSPSYWDRSYEKADSQYKLFKKLDSFGLEEYKQLANHCKKVGIDFMTTAFDDVSLAEIDHLVSRHKIASADLNNVPLLRLVAQTGKPIIISTGASRFSEIDDAILTLSAAGAKDIALLHCVLNYPTPEAHAHLGRITELKMRYPNHEIGYSDHTLAGDCCLAVLAAASLGATVIEKHFTDDKQEPGNDHYHSMDKNDLKQLTSCLKSLSAMVPWSEERFVKEQASAIENARRSIVTKVTIEKGQTLTEANITTKRPGKGISPTMWDVTLGATATRTIEADSYIRFGDFERSDV